MSLLTRTFLANAAVLATITLLLLFTPIEISYPVTETQSVILVTGLVVSLAINLVLLGDDGPYVEARPADEVRAALYTLIR